MAKKRKKKKPMPRWLKWTLGLLVAILTTTFAFSFHQWLNAKFDGPVQAMMISGSGLLLLAIFFGGREILNATKNKMG